MPIMVVEWVAAVLECDDFLEADAAPDVGQTV